MFLKTSCHDRFHGGMILQANMAENEHSVQAVKAKLWEIFGGHAWGLFCYSGVLGHTYFSMEVEGENPC